MDAVQFDRHSDQSVDLDGDVVLPPTSHLLQPANGTMI